MVDTLSMKRNSGQIYSSLSMLTCDYVGSGTIELCLVALCGIACNNYLQLYAFQTIWIFCRIAMPDHLMGLVTICKTLEFFFTIF